MFEYEFHLPLQHRSNNMRTIFYLLLFILTIPIKGQVSWQPSVINYSRQEYGAGNQNWKIHQHPNGWMFFSNNDGLLKFDGINWKTYPLPHREKMRSLVISDGGKIYVGGLGQFGYFSPNKSGGLDYTSISEHIRLKDRANIWNVLSYRDRVYFQSDRCIYYIDNASSGSIDCKGCNQSAIINGKIYFTNEFGLNWINGSSIINVNSSKSILKSPVVSMLPFHGKLLLVTSSNGLWLYGDGQFTRFVSNLDQFTSNSHLSCASIDKGTMAIGTMDNGVIIYDILKNKTERLSVFAGLQNKTVLSLTFDREHNLWLGLDNGIDYISLNSPLYFLYSKYSSLGSGYCALSYNSQLYLGTNQGLFVTFIPTPTNHLANLQPVSGTEGQTHCLENIENNIFCGGRRFFLKIRNGQLTKYNLRGVWHVERAGDNSNTILAGTYWGLSVLRKQNNDWVFTNNIHGLDISAKSMLVEDNGHYVWLGNKSSGLWRIKLDADFHKVVFKRCYNSKYLPKGDNVCIASLMGNIVFATRQGLFRYNPKTDRLEKYKELEKALDGNVSYTYIEVDEARNIWYVTDGILKRANLDWQTGKIKKVEGSTFLDNYLMEDFENVNFISDYYAVVSIEDGFALLDLNQNTTSNNFNLQIRRVYLTNGGDSLIYEKSIVSDSPNITIPYNNNSLRIEYGADNYSRTHTLLYSYRLLGSSDDNWSTYRRSRMKEYTNLHEGKYTFEVRMSTPGEKPTNIASFPFRVLPPWYRSWWAYTIYLLIFIILCHYLYKLYKRQQSRIISLKNAELIQQKEIFEKNINDKDEIIVRLEEEHLRSQLRYKSDELAQTTLNIVRKNEILQKIRKEAESSLKNIDTKNKVGMRRALLRLISQIDTNIEHDADIEKFQDSFDEVHQDFFKKLDAQFPMLNHRDKMLCAYIQMNLMTKEIAPLLNISVRGVEISRYRLRKKLSLDNKENLTEFLQRL